MKPTSLRPLIAAVLVAALAVNARFALADVPQAPAGCPAAAPEQARALAELLFNQGEYQKAARCYEAGGDYVHANRAFLEAVGPESTVTAQRVSNQADNAKALLHQVRRAFTAH
ncbi:MAG: hypothetical protein JSR67_06610 [Proteobacteria bacterium]|nr:hypothetical protein [Pseudomonadota bacterium]